MNSMPLVSIVIPAYNCEKTIAETLDSVFQQTYRNIQIIVVNDGSTDRTLDVISHYSNRITLITKTNGGVADARNVGMRMAGGEFISFCDADDVWAPQKIEQQIIYLQKHPDVGMVYCGWHVWNPVANGVYMVPADFKNPVGNMQIINPALSGWIYHKLLLDCYCLTSTVLIRKQVVEQIGWFETSLKCGEDYDYWLRASRITQIHKLETKFVLYRAWPQSITRIPVETHYEYEVLKAAIQHWGWTGPDGGQNTPKENNLRIAKMRFDFGYLHATKGNPKVAAKAFFDAIIKKPSWHLPWIYLAISIWKMVLGKTAK